MLHVACYRPLAKIDGGTLENLRAPEEFYSDSRRLFFSAVYFFPPSIFISRDPRFSGEEPSQPHNGISQTPCRVQPLL